MEILAVSAMPDVRDRLTALGFSVDYLGPIRFGARMAEDHAAYKKVIENAGLALKWRRYDADGGTSLWTTRVRYPILSLGS
jgi:hypothetical protein